MKLKRILAVSFLSTIFTGLSITPASASLGDTLGSSIHQESRLASASAPLQTDYELCYFFRPYGIGGLFQWNRYTTYDISCGVLNPSGCYYYRVSWFGGWNGPFDVRLC